LGYYSEALYESDELPKVARDHAALVASKVYYFLGEYDEALSFALGAGRAFHAETRTYGSEEYVETIVCASLSFDFDVFHSKFFPAAKAIDRYIQSRIVEQSSSKEKIDPRLQDTIEGIFNRCIAEGEYKQVAPPFFTSIKHPD
jgi:26S proteasome regulatory subunit N2